MRGDPSNHRNPYPPISHVGMKFNLVQREMGLVIETSRVVSGLLTARNINHTEAGSCLFPSAPLPLTHIRQELSLQ